MAIEAGGLYNSLLIWASLCALSSDTFVNVSQNNEGNRELALRLQAVMPTQTSKSLFGCFIAKKTVN